MDTVTAEVVRVTLDPCVDTRLISNAFGIRITQMGRATDGFEPSKYPIMSRVLIPLTSLLLL